MYLIKVSYTKHKHDISERAMTANFRDSHHDGDNLVDKTMQLKNKLEHWFTRSGQFPEGFHPGNPVPQEKKAAAAFNKNLKIARKMSNFMKWFPVQRAVALDITAEPKNMAAPHGYAVEARSLFIFPLLFFPTTAN